MEPQMIRGLFHKFIFPYFWLQLNIIIAIICTGTYGMTIERFVFPPIPLKYIRQWTEGQGFSIPQSIPHLIRYHHILYFNWQLSNFLDRSHLSLHSESNLQQPTSRVQLPRKVHTAKDTLRDFLLPRNTRNQLPDTKSIQKNLCR